MSDEERRDPPSPEERLVMRLLFNRGHYQETPDDLLWARHDAERAVRAYPEGREAVVAALMDTGLHGDAIDDGDCLSRDVSEICELLGAGGSE